LCGALEMEGHPNLGLDSGTLAGHAAQWHQADRRSPASAGAMPRRWWISPPHVSTMLAELAAQARIVHVIGTTGFDDKAEARIQAGPPAMP
jgi:4-hydroxy-tetrahydrodipicolinate reductase